MNKKKLLEEILDSPGAGDLREATLEAGLRAMRRKRKGRALIRSGAVALALVVVAGAGILSSSRRREAAVAPAVNAPSPKTATAKVEVIDGEQLLALFPDRPVALVGAPGKQALILPDEHAANGSPRF